MQRALGYWGKVGQPALLLLLLLLQPVGGRLLMLSGLHSRCLVFAMHNSCIG
jgi:hypothetical protein